MKPAATPELLAPAGNLETALAAYDAGADAVYCGLGKFNARERAQNFTPDSLARLLDYAHGRGRKLYLTLNTLVKETELSEVAAYLAELAKLRPDALIVQDLGVLNLAREYFPSLVLHASTQMGIHNSAGVAAAARLGIRRVILERQITLDELRKIAARSTLELEVFIHGSLCCSLSGQCLLSSALGGWSGNRGKCKQPCRRIYDAAGRSGFLLSPRDLYGVPLLPELRRIGVASLKSEGRLRSPDYVWKTVKAYRLLLDGPVDSPPELLLEAEKLLRSTATRRPSNGFYFANEYSSLIDAGRLGSFGVAAAKVGKYARAGLSVTALERLHLGDRLRLVPPEGGEGESFTLIDLRFQGKSAVKVRAGANCFIPGEFRAEPGWLLYKIGENGYDFSRQAAALPPGRHPLAVSLRLTAAEWTGTIAELPGECWRRAVDFAPAGKRPFTAGTAAAEFASAVPEPWSAPEVEAVVEGAFFVPASLLKTLRREFWEWAAQRLRPENLRPELAEALYRFYRDSRALPGEVPPVPEGERMILPGFTPEAELPALRKRLRAACDSGVRVFQIGALHGLELLREFPDVRIIAGFPLPVCNSEAVRELKCRGVCAVEPFAELDEEALAAFREKSPLPLVESDRSGAALLVTRLELPGSAWTDGRGRRFRVVRGNGLSKLYAAEPVDFRKNEWK